MHVYIHILQYCFIKDDICYDIQLKSLRKMLDTETSFIHTTILNIIYNKIPHEVDFFLIYFVRWDYVRSRINQHDVFNRYKSERIRKYIQCLVYTNVILVQIYKSSFSA